ncbi:OmpA family protein [Akkermansiaceae bacterium]|nr:OmpA family protein [Akkermansiaceae bacterium]
MGTYDSYEPRSSFGLVLFIGVLVACVVSVGIFVSNFDYGSKDQSDTAPEPVAEVQPAAPVEPVVEKEADPFDHQLEKRVMPADSVMPSSPEEMLAELGAGFEEIDPEVLLKKIGTSLEEGEIVRAAAMIGKDALDESHLKAFRQLSESGKLKLHLVKPVSEIGELEANRRARWAINLDNFMKTRIYFDLARGKSGKWAVDKVNLPAKPEPGKAVLVDSLGITDAFLQSALQQDFDVARAFVDPSKVSDAKIAGLCIIFEEAKYHLRVKKPLRAMFNRELTAGFMAHVQDESGEKAAEFGVSVQRSAPDQPWRITEVNLDSLLADYATRVAGGDVHYTPLIKNPTGGDTLILYFGFDENELTPRTQRQLDIVAGLLKLDESKKLTLSGHTDALGSDDYNNALSAKRAKAVETYLLSAGVPRSQITALAEGETKPRRPNATETGEDNPTGRRANRRTEIYLDF